MMEKFLISFLEYKNLIIWAISIFLLLYILLRVKKIDIKNSKKIFPIIFNMNNKEVLKLSLLIFKSFLIIYLLFSREEVTLSILLMFIIVDSIYNVVSFDILGSIFDYINSIFIFGTLFLNNIINEYISTVKFNEHLVAINILIAVFIVMYSIWLINIKLLKIKYSQKR